MTRYFFHVHDGQDFRDTEGTELPHITAARCYAVSYSGDLLKEQAATFWDGHEWRMDVTNEIGLILFSLHFLAIDAPSTGPAQLS